MAYNNNNNLEMSCLQWILWTQKRVSSLCRVDRCCEVGMTINFHFIG